MNDDNERSKARFDLVDMINRITPSNIEFHLNCNGANGVEKCSFLGPNTNVRKRLEGYPNVSRVITPPINRLDELAMHHDIAYHDKNLQSRHQADRVLKDGAKALIDDPNTDSHTRRNAHLVKMIMSAKLKLGMGNQ